MNWAKKYGSFDFKQIVNIVIIRFLDYCLFVKRTVLLQSEFCLKIVKTMGVNSRHDTKHDPNTTRN